MVEVDTAGDLDKEVSHPAVDGGGTEADDESLAGGGLLVDMLGERAHDRQGRVVSRNKT